jgi:hypothetical protein
MTVRNAIGLGSAMLVDARSIKPPARSAAMPDRSRRDLGAPAPPTRAGCASPVIRARPGRTPRSAAGGSSPLTDHMPHPGQRHVAPRSSAVEAHREDPALDQPSVAGRGRPHRRRVRLVGGRTIGPSARARRSITSPVGRAGAGRQTNTGSGIGPWGRRSFTRQVSGSYGWSPRRDCLRVSDLAVEAVRDEFPSTAVAQDFAGSDLRPASGMLDLLLRLPPGELVGDGRRPDAPRAARSPGQRRCLVVPLGDDGSS